MCVRVHFLCERVCVCVRQVCMNACASACVQHVNVCLCMCACVHVCECGDHHFWNVSYDGGASADSDAIPGFVGALGIGLKSGVLAGCW